MHSVRVLRVVMGIKQRRLNYFCERWRRRIVALVNLTQIVRLSQWHSWSKDSSAGASRWPVEILEVEESPWRATSCLSSKR